jgi:hypothetical protein
MVDLIATKLQDEGVTPPASRKGGQAEAAVAKPPNVPSPPSTNGANSLYRQLAEIHAIAAVQLAKCARWHRSSPTPSMSYVGASGSGTIMEPSTARMAPPPPTSFSPLSMLWQRGQRVEPQAN